jgi:TonB family protein
MYFLKVNVAIALFYLFFRLAFYNDTFWKTRRFYLVFSILLSVVYPFISFTDWLEKQEPMQVIVLGYTQLQEITITPQPTSKLTVENILLAVYALVSAFLLVKMLVQLVSILRWRWKGEKQLLQGIEIISVKEKITPFSFFNMIFINPSLHNEQEIKQILTHELTHARQMHSLDVLLSELLVVCCWVNPAAWLLKREIRQNLEFLADNSVLESGFDSKGYQYHLLELSYQTPDVKLGNKFNVSPLKKRITMMNQQKTSKAGLLKYSLIVPLALALILSSNAQTIVNSAKKAITTAKIQAVSIPKKTVQQATPNSSKESTDEKIDLKKVYEAIDVMPQFPGGDGALSQYIGNNLRYPTKAMESGIQGKVITRFVVTKSGRVQNVEIVKGVDPALDAEAIKVVKTLPNFVPGEQNGKKVAVWYTLPITYKLDGEQEGTRVYDVIEKMPQFPGGDQELLKYISQNVRYPADAHDKNIQGKVLIRFIVTETGKVQNPQILKSLEPSTDAEAIRVIKSLPDFIPGEQNGKKVAVWYALPITFKLTDDGKPTNALAGKVDKMPQFPGGDQELLKYIGRNLRYPAEAQKTGTQGKLVVRFFVSETGKVQNPMVLKIITDTDKKLGEVVVVGFGTKTDEKNPKIQANMELLEKEAVRLAGTIPDFIPAEKDGKKVAVYYTLPITFRLE